MNPFHFYVTLFMGLGGLARMLLEKFEEGHPGISFERKNTQNYD
jgi:hypothetical protein